MPESHMTSSDTEARTQLSPVGGGGCCVQGSQTGMNARMNRGTRSAFLINTLCLESWKASYFFLGHAGELHVIMLRRRINWYNTMLYRRLVSSYMCAYFNVILPRLFLLPTIAGPAWHPQSSIG